MTNLNFMIVCVFQSGACKMSNSENGTILSPFTKKINENYKRTK